jgi:DNA-binding Lrp family transcriptional regulator
VTAVAPRFDAVIHASPRLQICRLLAAVDTMEFAAVRDAVGVSDSVLSKHVKQLEEAGYVQVRKATVASRVLAERTRVIPGPEWPFRPPVRSMPGLPWIRPSPRRGRKPGSRGDAEQREAALSENGTAGTDAGDDDAVLLFVGGPLDGRVQVRAARHGEPPQTVTHVYLHDGPKVVHRYDLQSLPGQAGVYHVRPRAGVRAERDDAVGG